MLRILVALAITLSFASAAGRVHAATPATVDTSSSAAGATFTLPRGWSLAQAADGVVLSPPEVDTHIAIVAPPGAADARAAVTTAWALYKPSSHRPLKLATARPARNGWEERQVFDYELSPNEHAYIEAVAYRAAGQWTVAIVDGSEATVEKRGAAVGLILQSLRPKGYQRETFLGRPAHALDPQRVAAMKAFLQTSMDELGVPGAGFALIDHGKLVFVGGMGVRELGRPEPVGASTLFMIASNTKGMSTLLLARLVDAGKLAWDEPVTKVYPSFRLGSETTTRNVLMKNLVCACTGLPRKDYDWIFNTSRTTPASTTFTQLALTEPTSGFGEVFQYNNLMASAAGYIGGHIVHPDQALGAAYDAAMREQIFTPLGMNATTFDMATALASDHASPHGDDIDGKPAVASMDFNYSIEPYRPAGGAWSSAADLIKYVQDEITQGVLPDGTRLVSSANLLARRAPNVSTGEDGEYGMGLETDHAWGVTVVHHGGSMAGFKSDIMLVPDAQVGAVILTNSDTGQLMLRPFMRRLLEVLYDGKPEAAGDVAAQAVRNQAEIAAERKRLVSPPAAEASRDLAALYENPDLGHITVRRIPGGALVFDFGLWHSLVASRKNDDGTVSFVTIDPTNEGFDFVVSKSAGKRALVIRDGQHAYSYTEAG
jgi:CubicO group peptidase (beta-lactamase class C family)